MNATVLPTDGKSRFNNKIHLFFFLNDKKLKFFFHFLIRNGLNRLFISHVGVKFWKINYLSP